MSKKNKYKKRGTANENAEIKPQTSVSKPITQTPEGGIELITINKKVKIFIGGLIVLYVILSLSKIHTSNIGNWDLFFGKPESESVIAGKPRFIRMDEWMVTTPAIMGQYEVGLPVKNEAFGGGNAPVVFGLPIKDLSSVLRPSSWPYFIFDQERAFAFSWNFNIFFSIISLFLLFLLLSKNNFWLSVTGAFFVFLAPGVQWWTYGISTNMMYLNGMLISFIYILYSTKRIIQILSSLILLMSAFSFIASLYPPFQIPLVYLYAAIFIGFLFREKKLNLIKNGWKSKTIITGLAFVFLAFILYHYYEIAADTYKIMLNTVYPGKRSDTGGDLIAGKLFADYFSMFMNDTHTPQIWTNICEASGAIMFFPIIFYGIILFFIKYKKADPLLIAISLFIIFTLIYVIVGFPQTLSNLTLFSMSPAYRTLPVLGVANGVLLFCYLGSRHYEILKEKFSGLEFGILSGAIVIFMLAVTSNINKVTGNFFTSGETWIVITLITISYLMTRYKDLKFIRIILYPFLLILVLGNAKANPLTKGLTPVLENPLTQLCKNIYDADPKAGWAVFGNVRLTHLVKSTGANVLNGVKYVPNLDQMHILDPQKTRDTVYNRYAWVTMERYIDNNDGVNIIQTFNDSYTIQIDPCSPKLKELNIKYLVFDYKPQDAELRCLTKVAETMIFSIYKRNDQ